ncbi:MAG: NUDIX domain-containing protein [Gemmataceae bacterium]
MSEELVDVIDDAGNTIRVVPRSLMRSERLPHRCVYLLVVNPRRELFIHQRTATKDVFPSYWDVCVGGVLAAGETFDEGARREGGEELGVEVAPDPLFPFRYFDERTTVQAYVYLVRHPGPFHLQPEEVVQGLFVGPEELRRRISTDHFCPDGLAVLDEVRRVQMAVAGVTAPIGGEPRSHFLVF